MIKLLFLLLLVTTLVAPSTGKSEASTKSRKESRSGGDTRDVDPTACVEEMIMYEYPLDEEEFAQYFDEATNSFIVPNQILYDDEELQNPVMSGSFICQLMDLTHMLCNIVTTDEVGTTTLTGISELGSLSNTYVFTGGTDGYAGIVGKVTSYYDPEADVNVIKACLQE